MSRYEHQLIPAPAGMSPAIDPADLPENRARYLRGLAADKPGRLTIPYWYTHFLTAGQGNSLPTSGEVIGIWPYYSPIDTGGTDYVLFVLDKTFYYMTATTNYANPPGITFTTGTPTVPIGGNNAFVQDKRIRFAQYRNDVVIVQDSGLQPLRFTVIPTGSPVNAGLPALLNCGIRLGSPPLLTLVNHGGNLSVGQYRYRYTFFDEQLRECSPTLNGGSTESNSTQDYETTVAGEQQIQVGIAKPGDAQIQYVAIYRSLVGGSTQALYRLPAVYASATSTTSLANSAGLIPITQFTGAVGHTNNFFDNTSDAILQAGGILCPLPGENDPPNMASLVTVHKQRVVLNDSTDASRIQVSNLDSATQFTSYTTFQNAADGLRTRVGSDTGDEIMGMASFGSLLGIWKRHSYHQLWGDTVEDFTLRHVTDRGCIAPDSIARCDNEVLFLSEDGIYAIQFSEGSTGQLRSVEVASLLKQPFILATGTGAGEYAYFTQPAQAQGWYFQNRYHLALGTRVFVYDFIAQAWVADRLFDEFGAATTDESVAGVLSGLTCAQPVLIDRNVPLTLFGGRFRAYANADYTVHAQSIYCPAASITQSGNQFEYTVRFRPFGGQEPTRGQKKRCWRFTLFGTIEPGAVPVTGFPSYAITLTATADELYQEVYTMNSTLMPWGSGANPLVPIWQQQGILMQQQFTAAMVGRSIDVLINGIGVSLGGFAIYDALLEYSVLE